MNGPTPRQRVLDAAALLFAQQGIRAVGVDAIIASAAVAKASFYRHFPSKTDLVVAWLSAAPARWLDEVRAESERRTADPRDQLLVFFEVLGEWLAEDSACGCPYLNAAAELRDPPREVNEAIVGFLAEVEAYLRRLAVAAELAAPDLVGRQLRVLVAGSMSLALALGDPTITGTAADIARLVVEGAG